MSEKLKCPYCYNSKDNELTVKDRSVYELTKTSIKMKFMLHCGRCNAEWSFTELKWIKVKPLIYEKEYRISKSKEDFIEIMKDDYPNLAPLTVKRRYDEMQARYKLHKVVEKAKKTNKIKKVPMKVEVCKAVVLESIPEVDDDDLYEETTFYDDEIITPKKPEIQHYSNEHKSEPNYMKMITFKDMIRMKQPYKDKKYLMKYGFSKYEVNWLEDAGWI